MLTAAPACLGYAETYFLSITAVIVETMFNAADVELVVTTPH